MKQRADFKIGYHLDYKNQRSWDLFMDNSTRRSLEPYDKASKRAYRRFLWVITPVREVTGNYHGSADVAGYSISPDPMYDIKDTVA